MTARARTWVRPGAAGMAVAAGLGMAEARAAQVFDCVIEPSRTVHVGSPVTGVLKEVAVERGDRVQQGQPLARLEDRLERATVELQKMRASDESNLRAQHARLSLAQERMERFRQLLDRGATTEDSFDEAQAELTVNRAELERLEMQVELARMELERSRAALALRTIEASLDGIVTERVLSSGEFVDQDAHILKIADIDPLNVEVYLPVAYFTQLSIGDVGHVMPLEPLGGRYEARITVIDRVFDAASNTFGVRLSLDNPQGALPAGQRCTVELDVDAVELPDDGGGFPREADPLR